MRFLKRLVSRTQAASPPENTQAAPSEPAPRKYSEIWYDALHLSTTDDPTAPAIPGSWICGQPTLPSGVDWPVYRAGNETPVPMHFYAQLNLQHIPDVTEDRLMPTTGTLFFFFAPMISWEEGYLAGRVIYVEEEVAQYPPRTAPPFPSFGDLPDHGAFKDLYDTNAEYWQDCYKHISFVPQAAKPVEVYPFKDAHPRSPGWASHWVATMEAFEDATAHRRTKAKWSDFAYHHMFGGDRPIRTRGGEENINLLTLDCHGIAGMIDEDVGDLEFSISKDDLRHRRFENVVCTYVK
ncbi:MAG: DUF1963 domain-containing protein [Pseudomonadota bacterium]